MTETHSAADAYLRSVRRRLDAPAEDRDRLLTRLSHAVSAYVEENPEAAEEDIAAAFGTPENCAAELLGECDPARVAAVRRKKRRLLIAVIAVLVILVVVMVVAFVYLGTHQVRYVDTYITEDILDMGDSIS